MKAKIKNVAFILFTRFSSAGAIFLSSLLGMAWLSPEVFADFGFVYTVYSAFVLLPTVGVLNSMVINNERKNIVAESNFYRIVVVALVFLALAVLYTLQSVSSVFLAAAACGLIGSSVDFRMAVFQSRKNFRTYGMLMPLRSTLYLFAVSCSVFLFLESSYIVLYLYFILMGSLVASALLLMSYERLGVDFNLASLKKTIKRASAFYIYEVGALVMMRVEIWFLTFYSTKGVFPKADVGSYLSAYTIVFAVPIVTSSIIALMLPYVKTKSFGGAIKNKRVGTFYLLFYILFIALYGVAASLFVSFYFGDKFPKSEGVIWLLLLGMSASFVAGLVRLAIINAQSEAATNWVTLTQVPLSIFLGAAFIPLYGIYGAGMGFVLVRVYALFGFLVQWTRGRRREAYP